MNPVRRITSILALVLAGSCASGTQSRSFDAQVFEQRGRNVSTTVSGQHAFLVRITNRSEETIFVDSIELDPQTTSLQFYANAVAVDETLEPGQSREVNMVITVNTAAMNYITTIDSVDVSITARSASRGNFTETKVCTVIASQ